MQEVKKMKKTKYTVMVSAGVVKSTSKRVYQDETGKRYIREKGTYKCIENTPCINMMAED